MPIRTNRAIDIYRTGNRQRALSGGNVSDKGSDAAFTSALESEYETDINKRYQTANLALQNKTLESNIANQNANRAVDVARLNSTISYQNDILQTQKDANTSQAIKDIMASGDDMGGTGPGGKGTGTSGTAVSISPTAETNGPAVSGTTISSNKGDYSPSTKGGVGDTFIGIGKGLGIGAAISNNPVLGTAALISTGIGYGINYYNKYVSPLLSSLFSSDFNGGYGSNFNATSLAVSGEYGTQFAGGTENQAPDVSGSSANTGAGSSSRVICTELNRQGLLSNELYRIETQYGQIVHPNIVKGYHIWAIPSVRLMRKYKLVTKFVNWFTRPCINEMAHIVDNTYHSSLIGSVMLFIGLPLCWVIGALTNSTETTVEAYNGSN